MTVSKNVGSRFQITNLKLSNYKSLVSLFADGAHVLREAFEDDFALAGGFLMLGVRGVLNQRAAHGVVALVIRGLTVPATEGDLERVPGAVDRFGAPCELPVRDRAGA